MVLQFPFVITATTSLPTECILTRISAGSFKQRYRKRLWLTTDGIWRLGGLYSEEIIYRRDIMYNFRITCDNGAVCTIRARNRETAIMLYCKAEGCSTEWFLKHCTVRKMREV